MAEYYTKAESDAKYAATSHTHALEDLGGELSADRVSIPDAAAPLFEDAYTMDEVLFSIADQLAGKAAANHTHEDLTVTPAAHTHAQSEVTGLEARLTEIEADIADLQSGGSNVVTPMLVASMHLGKLDNNSGAEVTSASRICSDPFAVENGKSYWQVNDKGVNMYVLIYDADEMFLQYLGNFASGAEIAVNNANAAYMRISSLVGEYDLTNEFRIFDVNPASASEEEETFTQADADLLYAPIDHTHTGFAAAEHTHDYAAAEHTHTGFAAAEHTHDGYAPTTHTHTAADITGLPSSVDAYSKTEADARYAMASHTHDGYAAASHTHGEYLTEDEAVDAFAPISHTHNYASPGHTHTASEVGAAAANHGHSYNDLSDKPTIPTIPSSLPANGGNADTVDGKHASDFATSGHTHTPASIGAAASSHTHSGYAASNHTHSGYASSGHSHTPTEVGAVPATGGTFTGAVTIGYGLNTGTIAPFDGGSYSIGSSDNRYYSTYLRVNPNVSSDLRCKRDIEAMDINALAAFVSKLSVVNYNYNDDAADEAKRIGLIAQDVVAADPTIAQGCIEQDEKGFYSLRAADLVFPLIAAVQALTKRVEELEGN